ncbi:hypothetical protein EU527_03235 [Candidatus Thorarchaeota archaeon]|nr:MAG: hypothetical protein EU527_03235 [Candidatus Thorarchaeota archaeon]
MGSIWLSKKSFLYFGGAAIIILGGIIVVLSPYHYIYYSMNESLHKPWEMYDNSGYYPHLEISVSLRPTNVTIVELDLFIQENATAELTSVNMTLGPEHQIGPTTQTLIGPQSVIYEYSVTIDLDIGNYTVWFERIEGASTVDLGLNQASDSRLWIVTGGSMNIIGVVMIIIGYLIPGTFLPSDSDTIIEWGYEEKPNDEYTN